MRQLAFFKAMQFITYIGFCTNSYSPYLCTIMHLSFRVAITLTFVNGALIFVKATSYQYLYFVD